MSDTVFYDFPYTIRRSHKTILVVVFNSSRLIFVVCCRWGGVKIVSLVHCPTCKSVHSRSSNLFEEPV